jgi:peptide/nickel transport system ATP-binding protein
VACHVARLQRSGGSDADENGPILREFAGPQFVKTATESYAALGRELLLSVEDVSKTFVRRKGLKTTRTEAVQNASFVLHKGGVTALVGQSGSGKTTLARMITGVDSPTTGRILFHGPEGEQVVGKLRGRGLREYRRHVQMVFQDPYSSLNPTKTLGYILSRPLVNFGNVKRSEIRDRVMDLLETVALTPSSRYVNRFAYELSGGQRQRVVIARALAAEPQLIVADEPISSLDVSIRAEILELLNKLVHERDVGILYITHDLLSARMLSDEVVVLNHGIVVEQGPSLQVIRYPKDAYTRELLAAVPNPFEEVAG